MTTTATVWEVTATKTFTAIGPSTVQETLYAGEWQPKKHYLLPGDTLTTGVNVKGWPMEEKQYFASTPQELLERLFTGTDAPLRGWGDDEIVVDEDGHQVRRYEIQQGYDEPAPSLFSDRYHVVVDLDIRYHPVCNVEFGEDGRAPLCGTNEDGTHWTWYGNHEQDCSYADAAEEEYA